MYNIALNIISAIISFACISLPLSSTVNCYPQDVLVDIFSVLVTVLMGWNIISLVDIKKDAARINSVSKDMESVVRSILQLSIHSFTMRKDKEAVIDSCISSLSILQSCKDNQIRDSIQKEVMEVLHYIYSECGKNNEVKIYDHKQFYHHILKHTDSPYTEEIIEMISKATITERQESINFANENNDDEFSITIGN